MTPIPTGDTKAGSVLALSVVATSGVAELKGAKFTGPAGIAHASFTDAMAVGTAV